MLNGNILIKEEKVDNKFGIDMERVSVKAEVMGIGPGVTDIIVGDIVYMSKYTGLPYKDMRIVQEYDILGKEDNG
jgi:co-chaperonin GroES (HSP10)